MELLADSDLEKKTDFEDKKELEKLLKAIEKAKLELDAKVAFDEEHSLYEISSANGARAPKINWALAATPEYKRLRALRQAIDEINKPPFTIARNGDKDREGRAPPTSWITSSKTPKKISPSPGSRAWAK